MIYQDLKHGDIKNNTQGAHLYKIL